MKNISISIPRTPPSLNTLLNMNHFKVRRLQNIWDLLLTAQWMFSGKFVFERPVRIRYTISFPKKRRRDLDNYVGGTKLVTDALKRTFLHHDDAEWLRAVTVEFRDGDPETLIHIEEDVSDEARKIEAKNAEGKGPGGVRAKAPGKAGNGVKGAGQTAKARKNLKSKTERRGEQ